MPNLARAPSRAISSVAIWPVLRKAIDVGAVGRLDRRKRRGHRRSAPCASRPAAARPSASAQQRRGRAVGGVEDGQGFPALRTGHAEVDRVFGRRRQVDRLAVAEVDGQAATGRAEAADHPRRRVGRLAGGDLPQAEPARARAAARASAGRRGRERETEGADRAIGGCRAVFTTAIPPGIFGRVTAREEEVPLDHLPADRRGQREDGRRRDEPAVAPARAQDRERRQDDASHDPEEAPQPGRPLERTPEQPAVFRKGV